MKTIEEVLEWIDKELTVNKINAEGSWVAASLINISNRMLEKLKDFITKEDQS